MDANLNLRFEAPMRTRIEDQIAPGFDALWGHLPVTMDTFMDTQAKKT